MKARADKAAAVKPPSDKIREGDVDKLRDKVPAGKRKTKARCQQVLDALDMVVGEPGDKAIKRRGLKKG